MKKILILNFIVFFTTILLGQNIIRNSTFDEIDFSSCVGFDCVDFWEDDRDGNRHSPDLWGNPLLNSQINKATFGVRHPGFAPVGTPVILTGPITTTGNISSTNTHYAGMFRGEILEQKLKTVLSPGQAYKLSLYVRLLPTQISSVNGPPPNNGCVVFQAIGATPSPNLNTFFGTAVGNSPATPYPALNLLISNEKIKYSNKDNICSDPTTMEKSLGNSQGITVFNQKRESINLSPLIYPIGQWHYVEKIITVPDDQFKYDWIGLEVDNNCTAYVAMDNISLTKIICENCKKCSPYDACINACANNVHHVTDNFLTTKYFTIRGLDNVKFFNLKIFSISGQLLRTLDIDYPLNKFQFDGKSDDGNELIDGTYNYIITAQNECTGKSIKGIFFKSSEETSLTTLINPDSDFMKKDVCFYKAPEQCCESDILIDAKDGECSSNYFEINKSMIISAVNSVKFVGNVKIIPKPQAAIDIYGQVIDLTEGLVITANTGTAVTIKSSTCGSQVSPTSSTFQEFPCGTVDILPKIIDASNTNNEIKSPITELNDGQNETLDLLISSIYPNPVNNHFYVSGNNINFIVLNSMGISQKIDNINNIGGKIYVDCKSLSSGIYFIKFINSERATIRFIKQ